MGKILAFVVALLAFSTAFAQPCRGVLAGIRLKHEPARDHVMFARFDFWCHPSKTVALKQLATVDFGTDGRDFRDLRSVTFIDGPGSPADQEITTLFIIGAPAYGIPSVEPVRGALDPKPKLDEGDPFGLATAQALKSPTFIQQTDLHVPFTGARPVTFNLTREGMDDAPKMFKTLNVRLKAEDGGRRESRFKFFLETTDGQFLEVPVDTLADGETKDVEMRLTTPVPANGIKKIHGYFNHITWSSSVDLGVGNSTQDDDDARVLVSVSGTGPAGTGSLGRAMLQMTDWGNASSGDLSSTPKTYADMFLSHLDIIIQTGRNELHYNGSNFPSFKCSVTLNRNIEMVRHTSGPLAAIRAGEATYAGGFRNKWLAKAVKNTDLPAGFKLSDISEIQLTMDAGAPIPPSYTGSLSEPWDINMLMIRGVPKAAVQQPRPLIFANFTLNQTLRFNLNVSTGAVRSVRARFEGTPIKYRATLAPTR